MTNNVVVQQRKVTIPSICGVDEILHLISNEMEHSTVILSSDFVFYFERMTSNSSEEERMDGSIILTFLWRATMSTPNKSIQLMKIDGRSYKVIGLRVNNKLFVFKKSDNKPYARIALRYI